MRRSIIVANWKMHKTLQEAIGTYLEISNGVGQVKLTDKVDIVVASPFTFIHSLKEQEQLHAKVALAAQNCSSEVAGAYTGEVSAPMIKSVGANYVILGHSEPRQYLCETDDLIAKKLKLAIKYGLKPILCVGESIDLRNSNKHLDFVVNQLDVALNGFSSDCIKDLIIAYEPIWAIGTNNSASSNEAEHMHKTIRAWFLHKYGNTFSNNLRIIYGGSVNLGNIEHLLREENIDGALVGGASLNANNFIKMAQLVFRI